MQWQGQIWLYSEHVCSFVLERIIKLKNIMKDVMERKFHKKWLN